MKILNLELKNIRNFKNLKIDFSPVVNLIYGQNAAGKTNLIESIYYLTLTKSLRRGKDKNIIKRGEDQGIIKGGFQTEENQNLEIEFILGDKKIGKVDKIPSKIKEVVGRAQSVLFTAEDLDIIENPSKRRRFLNILISLLDKKYFIDLTEYQQILKRRNKMLFALQGKKRKEEELYFWDKKLADLGEEIVKKRIEIVKKINDLLGKLELFFKKSPLTLKYKTQAKTSQDILTNLKERLGKDLLLGQTTIGPHRDNIIFEANGFTLDIYGSRGEKRSAIIELKKAEIELIKGERRIMPTLLLDDVFSELDKKNRECILKIIENQQTIITTTNPEHLREKIKEARLYKIENGLIEESRI